MIQNDEAPEGPRPSTAPRPVVQPEALSGRSSAGAAPGGLALARSHVRPFAGSRARPDFHHLARRRVEEPLAGECPVSSGRSVERAALVAALAKKVPDQKEREAEAEGQAKRDHETGSITAAVP